MCKCTPNLRTPFCGKGDCVWPRAKGEIKLTLKDDINISSKQIRDYIHELEMNSPIASYVQEIAGLRDNIADLIADHRRLENKFTVSETENFFMRKDIQNRSLNAGAYIVETETKLTRLTSMVLEKAAKICESIKIDTPGNCCGEQLNRAADQAARYIRKEIKEEERCLKTRLINC